MEQAITAKRVEEQNMELMQTLDDASNAQDLETFEQRHGLTSWFVGRGERRLDCLF